MSDPLGVDTEKVLDALYQEVARTVEELVPDGAIFIQVEPEFEGNCSRFRIWLTTPLRHPRGVRKRTYDFHTETACTLVKQSYSSNQDEKKLIESLVKEHKARMSARI